MKKVFEFYNCNTGEIAYSFNDLTCEIGDIIVVYLNGEYHSTFVY